MLPTLAFAPTHPWDRGRPARLWAKSGRDARGPREGRGLVSNQ